MLKQILSRFLKHSQPLYFDVEVKGDGVSETLLGVVQSL